MNRFLRQHIDHILFWVLTVFFHGYTRLSLLDQSGVGNFVVEIIVRNGLLAIAVYTSLVWALPKLTRGKEIGSGILVILASIVFYATCKNLHDVYLNSQVMGNRTQSGFFQYSLYNTSIVTFYLAFSSALYLSKQWYLQRDLIQKIELEKLNTELAYLRGQINPHFLFNSINTIYFQIDKQNQTARETLGKFSDMLRYQLYECNSRTIAVEKEIAYLSNYIELQKLRMGVKYQIQFHPEATVSGFAIPPLLLLPLIENAFKHCSHFTDKKNEISIGLQQKDGRLHMQVRNTIEVEISKEKEACGIGLTNVTRRLDLLFGHNYVLAVRQDREWFTVNLEIPIS